VIHGPHDKGPITGLHFAGTFIVWCAFSFERPELRCRITMQSDTRGRDNFGQSRAAACFRPQLVLNVREGKHLEYRWTGRPDPEIIELPA
jgi:hypothetical protein